MLVSNAQNAPCLDKRRRQSKQTPYQVCRTSFKPAGSSRITFQVQRDAKEPKNDRNHGCSRGSLFLRPETIKRRRRVCILLSREMLGKAADSLSRPPVFFRPIQKGSIRIPLSLLVLDTVSMVNPARTRGGQILGMLLAESLSKLMVRKRIDLV